MYHLRGESTDDQSIPITKGQLCGNYFHVKRSSYAGGVYVIYDFTFKPNVGGTRMLFTNEYILKAQTKILVQFNNVGRHGLFQLFAIKVFCICNILYHWNETMKSLFWEDNNLPVLRNQFCGCWCPGDVRIQCHGIDLNDDVIKWKHFPRYWAFVRRIHRSPVNSPHKGQWRGAFMFSLICVWINGWVNNREAGDLIRYRAHYDVIVMGLPWIILSQHGKR